MSIGAYKQYSVLMAVYYKENASYLRQAIESIQNQTFPTNDFVLVCDGPLNLELDAVISEKQKEMGNTFHVIRLEKNCGLGNALNEGIRHCKNELIARMDSDDISYPDRCVRQMKVFELNPEIDICSGIIEEFSKSPDIIYARRVMPETSEEISKFAMKRNPFNHPCVMYKKTAVESSGSYQDFYLLEDYYLWIRMLMNGSQGYNLQEPLLYMRAGSDMYKRRAGWKYARTQIALFRYMENRGFINKGQCFISCVVRSGSSLAPNWIRELMFKKILRK